MLLCQGDSADQVWRQAAHLFQSSDSPALQPSRDGDTHEALRVIFEIRNPRQRWVLSRRPRLNPAFAIAELVWIVRGREDSAFLNYWNPQLQRFAGYGARYDGAYGRRLRARFGIDQLQRAYESLRTNPISRQVVLQLWDAKTDLPSDEGNPASTDVPCNICSLIKIRNGKLEWTQVLRSNDLILGVPYNFVQFTSLQEILAGWLDVDIGAYVHLSDSLHVYARDRGRLEVSDPSGLETYTESIALPKNQSDAEFRQLEQDMLEMMHPNLDETCLRQLTLKRTCPLAFRHFRSVVGAYAARKRGWTESVIGLLDACTHPGLGLLAQTWREKRTLDAHTSVPVTVERT